MDVVLVGPSLPGVENHSIAALRSALHDAGLSEAFVPFEGFMRLEPTAADVLEHRPKTVGISLQTIESALSSLVFAMLLRRRGFSGRIVIGGHFATLNAEALLESPAKIDAVVQFAGEEALVAVSNGALDDDAQASKVSGLVFRDSRGEIRKGAPPRWTSPAILSSLRRFESLPDHLGFPAADLVSSRGCEAHCSYCCIAGATDLVRRASDDHASQVYERRSASALADEIASLFHEHRARVFNFMDDNVLPLDPEDAASWAEELKCELTRRRVPKIAFSLQLRADVVNERTARALVDLGLVRAYVGVDGYSASHLRVLGRRADENAAPRALDLLWQQGVFAVVNALLVGPTIPFESIVHEIDALGRIAHAPVHLLPIEVRAGTSYFRAAERRGLIEGGFFHWHYRFVDERTQRMAEILTSFPTRLAERSVPIALYDLGYNLGIARRLLPELNITRQQSTYAIVAAQWNADQLRVLQAAAGVAAGKDRVRAEAFVAEQFEAVSLLDHRLRDDCDRALTDLERAASLLARRDVSGHARGRLLGALAFSMSLAACGGTVEDRRPAAAGGNSDASIGSTGGTAGSGGTIAMNGGTTGTAGTGGTSLGTGGNSFYPDGALITCPSNPYVRGGNYVMPGDCFTCYTPDALVQFDSTGHAVGFTLSDAAALSTEVLDCLQTLFAPYCYPSLANTEQSFLAPHCWIA